MVQTAFTTLVETERHQDQRTRAGDKIAEPLVANGLSKMFAGFSPMSLEETNRTAQMLTRFDNKYILCRKQLGEFLTTLETCYSVLEISGTRIFRYESCYFDQDYLCYYHHHNGKRLRFKVRTRHYVDAGSKYFEVKLKDNRGRTKKERIKGDWFLMEKVDGPCLSKLEEFYKSTYGREFCFELKPALIVSNHRVTLVSQVSAERMTIDFSVGFRKPDGPQVMVGQNFIIVETKSGNGKGTADAILRGLGIRKASKCSKYCLGVNLVGAVSRQNNFRNTLARVKSSREPVFQ